MERDVIRKLNGSENGVRFSISITSQLDGEQRPVSLSDGIVPDDAFEIVKKAIDHLTAYPEGISINRLSNNYYLCVTAK